jgi:hypothetical protein
MVDRTRIEEAAMTLNIQINEQLATAHGHDVLEAAGRDRLAAHASGHRASSSRTATR